MHEKLLFLKNHQNLLFWLELAGLLHDVGKLNDKFIEYRKTWQELGGKDPHEGDFLGNHTETDFLLKEKFPELHKLFQTSFNDLSSLEEVKSHGCSINVKLSIADLVKYHVEPGNNELAKILRAADGKDSAEDRNNPLLVNEQRNEEIFFKSSVFGYETPIPNNLDKIRGQFYCELQSFLCESTFIINNDLRLNIHKAIYEAFKQTVSDTCRPANDIILWEHSYATATLFKVFLAHFILYGEKILSFQDVRFAIWGIGWDGLKFYSRGHKIGDIVGRKAIIGEFKKSIRNIVEWEYSIGNTIYDDDNGVYFIIPEVKNGESWLHHIQQSIHQMAHTITADELPIVFGNPKNTNLMNPIVTVIEEIKKAVAIPWTSSLNGVTQLDWVTEWAGKESKEVCPVCRKRPRGDIVCNKCKEIRKKKLIKSSSLESLETSFHSEIEIGNHQKEGRLALIVARFDLKKWLDGTMLYSLFVKEAESFERAMKHLGEINDPAFIKPADKKRINALCSNEINNKKYSFDFKTILDTIKLCQTPGSKEDLAKAFLFIFDRHFVQWKDISSPPESWQDISNLLNELNNFYNKPVTFENFIVSKNHSPSRLLRTWNGTRDFFIEQARNIRESYRDEGGRIQLFTDGINDLPKDTILAGRAVFPDQHELNIEVVRIEESLFIINQRFDASFDWGGALLTITADEFTKKIQGKTLKIISAQPADVVRARTITTSPDIFMTFVPGDNSIDICTNIYENYKKEFAKVYGRLPLSIGVLYFKPQTPMFVVLDGASRFLKNFELLSSQPFTAEILNEPACGSSVPNTHFSFNLSVNDLDCTVELNCPIALGNGKQDNFHPYFIMEDKSGENRHNSFFDTLPGPLIHYSGIEKGDRISLYPNFFDFEYLDSTVRRYDLSLIGNTKKRFSGADRQFTRPFLFDELSQKVIRLWNELLSMDNMTDSKLRNIDSLLRTWKSWRTEDNGEHIFSSFVQTMLDKEVGNEQKKIFDKCIKSGLFFDTLELYLEILKIE